MKGIFSIGPADQAEGFIDHEPREQSSSENDSAIARVQTWGVMLWGTYNGIIRGPSPSQRMRGQNLYEMTVRVYMRRGAFHRWPTANSLVLSDSKLAPE